MSTARPTYLGVDGANLSATRRGWVAVKLDEQGFVDAEFHERFDDLRVANPEARAIGVDMPIGLLDTASRQADIATRKLLGKRASSVFAAPVRAVLEAASYEEACALSQRTCGKRLSRQTWGLVPRIREVDAHLADARIHEVHPELSFTLLAGGTPTEFSKKTWGGLEERRRLLASVGIEIPEDLGVAAGVAPDDVLDAAVAAWSARRIAEGKALRVPAEESEMDGARAVVIWG